uniref:Uncharacterized protein n=1 Tax=Crocodylus porosus TaxID=8502 RepID=A0A7M4FZM8_CROPO
MLQPLGSRHVPPHMLQMAGTACTSCGTLQPHKGCAPPHSCVLPSSTDYTTLPTAGGCSWRGR